MVKIEDSLLKLKFSKKIKEIHLFLGDNYPLV